MISNLSDYFSAEQEFYLDTISYNRITETSDTKEYSLNCLDNLEVKTNKDTLVLTAKRTLKFEPKEFFELTVSFGAILKFNKDKMNEYDWEKINLAEEFRENGQFVLSNLMNRISLLVAQITSSYGQTPIILSPGIASKDN